MEPILEIKNLGKSFKDFSLKKINLTLERGFIMGFIGPNGAGKSTTIKLIMNLLRKDEGEIRIFGKDHIKDELEIKNRIGFVFDENHFYEELTVQEMKWVVSKLYKTWDDAAFTRYIERFQLPLNRKIKDLSKGMKMKFALTIALSHNAELLIMDEPTSGLDPLVRSELLEILGELIQDENKAVFFSTHITSDLDKIADYITLINNGEIIFSTAKDDLLNNYGLVKGDKKVLDENLRESLIGLKENMYGFEGLVRDRNNVRRMFGDRVLVEKPSLEDIMLYYTRREQNV